MLNKRYFSANSVISAITLLIITMMVLIAGLVIYFLSVLNDKATEDWRSRVEIAFSVEQDYLLKLAMDYSSWDKAYEMAFSVESEWTQENYQDYLLPSYNLAYIASIDSDKHVRLHAKRTDLALQPQSIISSAVLERLRNTEQARKPYQTRAFFSEADGKIYMVAAEPYRGEHNDAIVDGSYLVLARLIDNTYLAVLSQRFRLPALSLDPRKSYDDSMSLEGFNPGSKTAIVHWSSPHIVRSISPYIVLILLSFLIVSVVLARLLLNKDFSNRALYQEKLFAAATTDPLTNVANRRYFMALGKKEFQLQMLQKHDLCLMVFDLDFFKSINDTYGHAAG